ncbi:hypothetical protein T492DRAFT_993736 [Pavlovales sp. CCMP2436]|nr:hypothetical protein T492DRAFT_993736 [Pavlovales sp. CCMP2436]|mmetsp:Transcript_23872/g.60406  ORF Transcript_23872/g.60406 Transcript_23872/m.60406 type:complete len:155 (+) Transcript_23872:47-511(+)
MTTTLAQLSGINADIAAAVRSAADAIEVLSSSDPQQLDAFQRHSDAFLERILSARAAISAHAHLMNELRGSGGEGAVDLLVYRTRLGPARQRLHLVNLLATSASDMLSLHMAAMPSACDETLAGTSMTHTRDAVEICAQVPPRSSDPGQHAATR